MGEISRAALFGKLNSVAYKAIEAATVFCKLRGNPYVELAHWFHQLLQLQETAEAVARMLPDQACVPLQPFRLGHASPPRVHSPRRSLEEVLR